MSKDHLGVLLLGAMIGLIVGSFMGADEVRRYLPSNREIVGSMDTHILCEVLSQREGEPLQWLENWELEITSYRACIERYAPAWAAEMAPQLPFFVHYPVAIDPATLDDWLLSAAEEIVGYCQEVRPDVELETCFERPLVHVHAYLEWARNQQTEESPRGE